MTIGRSVGAASGREDDDGGGEVTMVKEEADSRDVLLPLLLLLLLLLLLVLVVVSTCALVDDEDGGNLDVPAASEVASEGCLRGGFQITKVLYTAKDIQSIYISIHIQYGSIINYIHHKQQDIYILLLQKSTLLVPLSGR